MPRQAHHGHVSGTRCVDCRAAWTAVDCHCRATTSRVPTAMCVCAGGAAGTPLLLLPVAGLLCVCCPVCAAGCWRDTHCGCGCSASRCVAPSSGSSSGSTVAAVEASTHRMRLEGADIHLDWMRPKPAALPGPCFDECVLCCDRTAFQRSFYSAQPELDFEISVFRF